jgi:hypothetical protein
MLRLFLFFEFNNILLVLAFENYINWLILFLIDDHALPRLD